MIQGYPRFLALLSDGSPAIAYKVYSYAAGTTTPQNTYTSQARTAANTNPVILNASGEAEIWLDPLLAYKLVLKTDADVTVWTMDNIQARDAGMFTTLNTSGTATCANITTAGQLTCTIATGTPPLVITSTTKVTNLNADLLDGGDWMDIPDNGSYEARLQGTNFRPVILASDAGSGVSLNGPDVKIQPADGLYDYGAGGNIVLQQAIGPGTGSGASIKEVGRAATFTRIQQTPNGAEWYRGYITEEITLSTSGTTTDSTANMLPANAIIEAVVARVTQTITTATDWKLGDSVQAARFLAAQSGSQLTAGATAVGLAHADPTVASSALGPVQTSAAKLRVTTTGTPGAGKIRIAVFYRSFVAPTS